MDDRSPEATRQTRRQALREAPWAGPRGEHLAVEYKLMVPDRHCEGHVLDAPKDRARHGTVGVDQQGL